ncbi:translocation/assembly module TamB [Prevotella sp. P6B4]|uniref:translocation/assembly module TamB n=1 Tax=Prevotella sp. P6B4 TaxID=1410614 RepID=UPI0006882040|nr:translocation/assembly module TamB [Prevotella sp. P6B4]
MKLLKRFVSYTIWGVILLNVALMAVSYIPQTQNFLGRKVAGAISDKLGTHVTVGRIDLGFFNRVIIDNVCIEDQQQQDMLRVGRLSVRLEILPLFKGRIAISSAQLFGAHFLLYKENAQSQTNFQFVLDSLASKDTTSHTPLDLRINSIIIRRSSLTYDQYDQPQTIGLFNPAHLKVSDLSAHINLRTLTDDSLNINVKRLELKERCGLVVKRLKFHLAAGRKQSQLENLLVETPLSHLQIDNLSASYLLTDSGMQKGSLNYYGKISNTNITPSELSCFIPALKGLSNKVSIETDFKGSDTQVQVPNLLVSSTGHELDIQAHGWVADWQKRAYWNVQLNRLAISEDYIGLLAKAFPQIPTELTRLGSVQLTANCERSQQGAGNLQANLQTGAGEAKFSVDLAADQSFAGTVDIASLSLQQLLANNDLGKISTTLALKGQLHEGQKPDVNVEGLISDFDYKGYTYHHLALDGGYNQGKIAGHIDIDDPNLEAEIKAELSDEHISGKALNSIKLQAFIERYNPQALHLTDQWSNATLSGQLEADIAAHNLNDAQGNIRLSNFNISATEQHPAYRLDNLNITTGHENGIHFLSIKSDFADAELKGQFDYKTLAASFTNLLKSKLPTLPILPAKTTKSNNNFVLRLMVSKSDWLRRIFNIDLQLRQPVTLQARVNDYTNELYLNGAIPSFAYNGAWYNDGFVNISSPADTMRCNVSIQKLMDNGQHLDLGLSAHAANNNLTTAIYWDNHDENEHMSGEMNTIMQLYHNVAGKPEAHFRVMPSHIILRGEDWDVEPSDVLYTDKFLLVDHFSVHHGAQHIIVDGIASKNDTDSLTVDLREVEVGYILDLVNFHSVEFSGKATGKARAWSLFDEFKANADLTVEEFKFERGRMGVLHALANWNHEAQQIDIHAVADDGPDAKTRINGYVSPVHNTIDLGIEADGTSIEFMHNFTKSFLSSINGRGEGTARLSGTLDNINLTGNLIVDGEATVTPLNTTYKLVRDTVVMIPDEIELRHMAIYDALGHKGILSGGIHHQHLTNLSYDLNVEADDLLAYDFKDFTNPDGSESTFYGTVYASGNVSISGHGNDVIIDCNVTPQPGTVFVYNAASPDAISNQEFISWEQSGSTTSSGTVAKSGANIPVNTRADDTDIYINFQINATPNAALKLLMDENTKDYITLYGNGSLRASFHNKGSFNMFGTYTVDHGTYGITIQNIIKKNFTFNRGGTIVFGGDPYQAALNLQAVYTVSGVSLSDLNIGNSFSSNTIRVNCLMNIGGQPAAPQVDFDLEMPTVNADEQQMVRSVINGQQEMNQQVVYLLAIGRFYNQGANNSTSATGERIDQTSLAMQSFLSGTLSSQINSLINQFIKNDNWNFGANISTGNEGWHNAEYEGIINGRMLNNRLLINGQFGYRDNATQASPSFIGDFDVQYLLYPNGNLALKVYNQTNDRYFTKSSLNTQGIGLIMKKDFNGLRDLFSTKKRKKKSAATNVKENHTK